MKLLKKRPVALAVMIAAIVLASFIGISRGRVETSSAPIDTGDGGYGLDALPTGEYEDWIEDKAGVLSGSVEEKISLYNANWDERYHSLVAVVTVDGTDSDIADFAYDYGAFMGLGEGDAILVLDIGGQDAYLATGDDFATMLTDSMATAYMDDYLYEPFMAGDYEEGVLDLFAALHKLYVDSFGLGDAGSNGGVGYVEEYDYTTYFVYRIGGGLMQWIVLLIVFLIIVAVLADNRRYRRYRSGYYGPGYVYRPIFFGWPRAPRPPRPPRPGPGPGPGGPRPGGPRPGGGFGGSRPGGGRPSGGSFGGSRGGSFGGSSRGGGGFGGGGRPRGGSFGGGSRGGGGFSRGGGSRGGSRGGSFGGRR